jgi:hypothetical protein
METVLRRAPSRPARAARRARDLVVTLGVLYTMSCVVDPATTRMLRVGSERAADAALRSVEDLRGVLTKAIFDYAIVPGLFVALAGIVVALWVGQKLGVRVVRGTATVGSASA